VERRACTLNKTIYLYPRFFWGRAGNPGFAPALYPPLFRAASLVHESRHQEKAHTNQTPSDCGRLNSCDPSFDYGGANAWEVAWLFYYHRRGVDHDDPNPNHAMTTSPTIRNWAFDQAESILYGGFHERPDFALEDVVGIYILHPFI